MSEILRFRTNEPHEVRLRFADGKDVTGEYGPQVMFSLTEPAGSVMYLPPIAAERIYALGIQAGELISIAKAEVSNGRRKGVEWQVKRVEPSAAPPAPSSAKTSGAGVQPIPDQQTHPTPALPQVVPPRPAPQVLPVKAHYGEFMTDCLIASLQAAQAAERWAAEHNCSVRFTSEDVQGLASTLFIQASREGIVSWKGREVA